MTLIFSNENRILFNIKNRDQLLLLSYGTHSPALLERQKLYRQKSTPYKTYLERKITTNFVTSPVSDRLSRTNLRFVTRAKLSYKYGQMQNLAYKYVQVQSLSWITSGPFRATSYKSFTFRTGAKLCIQIYDLYARRFVHTNELSRLYRPTGLSQRKKRFTLYLNSTANLFADVLQILERKPFVPIQKEKKPQEKHFEIEKKQAFSLYSNHTERKRRNFFFFVTQKVKFLQFVIYSNFTSDHLSSLNEKIKTIKTLLPKVQIWGFAFGSSFLLVSMSSILQRQEQNRWFFTFSKKQMPGLYLTSQESSWECFENIALKYLNRKSLGYKHRNSKGLVKNIDCYKDIWSLVFSDSWNQQFIQNYTAVFPKHSSCTCNCKSNICKKGNMPYKSLSLASSHKSSYVQGSALFFPQKKRALSYKTSDTKFGSRPRKKALHNNSVSRPCTLFVEKKQWVLQPWYQMHARVPPKKSFLKNFGDKDIYKKKRVIAPFLLSGNSCDSILCASDGYKARVNDQNDSIPGKISCSKKRGKNNKNYIYSPNDILKNLFYKSGTFSIDSQALQTPSLGSPSLPGGAGGFAAKKGEAACPLSPSVKGQDIDSFSDFSLKKRIDLEKDIDSNRLSFLQQESFFKDSTLFKDQHEKTSFFNPLYQLKRESLSNENSQSKLQKKYRSYQSYQHTLSKNCKATPKPLAFFCRASISKSQGETKTSNLKNYRYKKNEGLPSIFDTIPRDPLIYSQREIKTKVSHTKLDLPPVRKNSYTNLKPSLSKSAEKLFSYLLCKRKSVSNRFMSGYKTAEINRLQVQVPKTSYSIKVPPALPFSESRVKSYLFDLTKQVRNEGLLNKLPRLFSFSKEDKREKVFSLGSPSYKSLPFTVGDGAGSPSLPLQIEDLYGAGTPSLPGGAGGFAAKKGFAAKICTKGEAACPLSPSYKSSWDNCTKGQRQALKKMPYRELCLNELQEVKPLFEQVNKTFRINPYYFAFNVSLFTDYNDYLSWPKDTAAAISISPSLEEEEAIKKSWNEHLILQEQNLSEKGIKKDLSQEESLDALQGQAQIEDLQENVYAKQSFATPAKQKNFSPSFTVGDEERDRLDSQNDEERLAASPSIGEEEEKKREITKFEWLQQVREAEQLVEKRKDFQKDAYPNKKALLSKRVQTRPGFTEVKRSPERYAMIQNLLVSDRKLSFFGIPNLLPKRLVAQDQKQINSQILRDEHDRRSISLLQQSVLKRENTETNGEENKNHIFVEDLLKSGALSQLKKRNGLDLKKPKTFVVLPVRTAPRNRQKNNSALPAKSLTRQHPIYTPNRRLRLRLPQSSFSSQNNNPQSRIDDLNISQSHRWWQKRRLTPSLLGAPSKRYLVMPEIRTQDWRKIIEWQLKTYFIEEEKRVESLVLENKKNKKGDISISKEKQFFKIKKIAIFLPWTTLKKTLKKPFEWPLTGLSYRSSLQKNLMQPLAAYKSLPLQIEDLYGAGSPSYKSKICTKGFAAKICTFAEGDKAKICKGNEESTYKYVKTTLPQNELQSFLKNKKADFYFVSSIAPHFKASPFFLSNKNAKSSRPDNSPNLHDLIVKQLRKNSVYKPFLFEGRTKHSYLLLHQLVLAIAAKLLFQSIYKIFGKIIIDKIKNSSLALVFLPIFFNSRSNQIPEFYNLKKRLKDLVGSEDTISSLSEIVWYLRNSCRGRMIPRGVVLVETLSSESTEFLKAIGGEAQVPVIVQSLRALPFTQNHPQRRLEKILTFAQKRAPCILFLDDLDSIGQSRTLLLKNSYGQESNSKAKLYNFTIGSGEILEKKKWGNARNELSKKSNQRHDLDKFSFSCARNRNTESQESHTSLLNSFLSKSSSNHSSIGRGLHTNRGFMCEGGECKVSPCKGLYAKGRGTNLIYNSNSNSFQSRNTSKFKGKRLHSETSSSPLLRGDFSETEKMIEQRRVDLMLRLLTVMDGISHLNGVLIVTTSKNPSSLDPALLRPGRFEKLINLKLPNKKKRIELLKVQTAKLGHTNPMPWEYLGTQTQDMTGTEIASAINHSAFRGIIQSTVHTFPTLEYGIGCVNRDKFSAYIPDHLSRKQSTFFTDQNKKEVCKTATVNRKFACFLKQIRVHNPYKTSFRLSTRRSEKRTSPIFYGEKKAIKEISSLFSFYQAGKGVVQSLILNSSHSSFSSFYDFSFDRKKKKRGEKKKALYKQSPNTEISVQRKEKRFVSAKNERDRAKLRLQIEGLSVNNLIKTNFNQKIIRLYAGQASELLYLNSIACSKTKVFTDTAHTSTYKYRLSTSAKLRIQIGNLYVRPLQVQSSAYKSTPFTVGDGAGFWITSGERQSRLPHTNRRFVRATSYKSSICTKGFAAKICTKAAKRFVPQMQNFALPLFLHSNFSYRDRIEASPTIENIATSFRFYQSTKSPKPFIRRTFVSPLNGLSNTTVFRFNPHAYVQVQSLACKYKASHTNLSPFVQTEGLDGLQTRALHDVQIEDLQLPEGAGSWITSGPFQATKVILPHTNRRFVRATSYKSSCKAKHTSTNRRFVRRFVRTCTKNFAAKTRFLRKGCTFTEGDSLQNLEIYTQEALYTKLSSLRFSFIKGDAPVKNILFSNSTDFVNDQSSSCKALYTNRRFVRNPVNSSNTSFSYLRKYLQFNKNNDPDNFVSFYDEIGKDAFWGQKISETLKIFKRTSGNWYRLYLPKIEQNKNNREWLLPDHFSSEHISILKQNLSVQDFASEETKKCVPPHKFYKASPSTVSRKEVGFTPANRLSRQQLSFSHQESCTDFLYYNTVLSCFYVAFQNCNENRELLDFLADHLIRFKILRLHEIIRIASFYL